VQPTGKAAIPTEAPTSPYEPQYPLSAGTITSHCAADAAALRTASCSDRAPLIAPPRPSASKGAAGLAPSSYRRALGRRRLLFPWRRPVVGRPRRPEARPGRPGLRGLAGGALLAPPRGQQLQGGGQARAAAHGLPVHGAQLVDAVEQQVLVRVLAVGQVVPARGAGPAASGGPYWRPSGPAACGAQLPGVPGVRLPAAGALAGSPPRVPAGRHDGDLGHDWTCLCTVAILTG